LEKIKPFIFPKCKYFYNLYHKNDPIAYRIEPLALENYVSVQPIKVPIYKKNQKINMENTNSYLYEENFQQRRRIDYEVAGSFLQFGPNQYILSLYNHISYWKSNDTVFFVLNRLCQKSFDDFEMLNPIIPFET